MKKAILSVLFALMALGGFAQDVEQLKESVGMGQMEAALALGNYYANQGDDVSLEEAQRWYMTAAKSKELAGVSYTLIAGIYELPSYKGHDLKKALKYYKKAAGMGTTDALNSMAYMYAEGRGVKKNFKKAYALIDKALKQSDNPNYIDSKGEFYSMEGDKDNALKMWTKANDRGLYYFQDTKLSQYILENFKELPIETNAFTLLYPTECRINKNTETQIELSLGDEAFMFRILQMGEKNYESADEILENIVKGTSETYKSNGSFDISEMIETELDGVKGKALRVNTANKYGVEICYVVACDNKEKNITTSIFAFGSVDPLDKLNRMLETFRWKSPPAPKGGGKGNR